MSDAKTLLFVALAVAVGCGVAGVLILRRQAPKEMAPPTAKAARQAEPARPADEALPAPPPEGTLPAVAEAPAPAPADSAVQSAPPPEPARAAPRAPKTAPQAAQGGRPPKEPLKDPLAREALALVGLDPGAEEYWYAAINDPDLSAHERQDLIEDLNEEGLSDPKHPRPEDLPVILSRLWVIEAAGPYAMDQVNADAFQEAYKDLVTLADLALGGGEPVR